MNEFSHHNTPRTAAHSTQQTTLYTVGHKNVPLDIRSIFGIFFTVGLISKFAMRLVSYFPPHLQRVAVLPCEKHNI